MLHSYEFSDCSRNLSRMVRVLLICFFPILSQNAAAQDLSLPNTTVSSTQVFTAANSITAGPNFIVTATGNATLNAPRVALKPEFYVLAGGRLQVVSKGVAVPVRQAEGSRMPADFFLAQNYPNPFNPKTRIRYGLPRNADVRIDIFNVLGQRVRTLVATRQQAGYHTVTWNGLDDVGRHVAHGIYFYRLRAGDWVQVKKMVIERDAGR